MQSFSSLSSSPWNSSTSNSMASSLLKNTDKDRLGNSEFTASSRNMPSTLWIVLVCSIVMNVIFIVSDKQRPIVVDRGLLSSSANSTPTTSQTMVYVRDSNIYLGQLRASSSSSSSSSFNKDYTNNDNNINVSSSSSSSAPTSNSSTPNSVVYSSLSSLVATTAHSGSSHNDDSVTTTPITTNHQLTTTKNDDYDSDGGTTEFLLTVPFYIYPELLWTHLDNATFGKQSIDKSTDKHSDDFYFVRAAIEHPMRTFNASQAQIFVVPFLENTYERDFKFSKRTGNHLCVQGRCSQQYIQHMIQTISNSPYLQEKPHIMVGSHCNSLFSPKEVLKPQSYNKLLNQMYVITFENMPKGRRISIRKKLTKYGRQQEGTQALDTTTGITHYYRRGLPTTYVGRGCKFNPNANRTIDVAFISKIQSPAPDRKFIYNALTGIDVKINNTKTTMNQHDWMTYVVNRKKVPWEWTYPLKPMPQCPSLANARYGFHVAGDSPTSDRLLATILSGTIPIFTRQTQLDMIPDWIDWNKISAFIDLDRINGNKEMFLQELRTILEDEDGYQRRYKALLENIKLFDWVNTINPFDMYMYRIQAEEYPETRHVNPTKIWNILPNHLLPPPIPQMKK